MVLCLTGLGWPGLTWADLGGVWGLIRLCLLAEPRRDVCLNRRKRKVSESKNPAASSFKGGQGVDLQL